MLTSNSLIHKTQFVLLIFLQNAFGKHTSTNWDADQKWYIGSPERRRVLWEISFFRRCKLTKMRTENLSITLTENVSFENHTQFDQTFVSDLLLDKQDQARPFRHGESYSYWVIFWKTTTLCSEGTLIVFKVDLYTRDLRDAWMSFLEHITDTFTVKMSVCLSSCCSFPAGGMRWRGPCG